MKVIIPMSGVGARFREAGYEDIKPLIKVGNKPIIEYVVEMFSSDDDFVFICNSDHLKKIPELSETLKKIAPNGKIIPIEPHKKGPVHALLESFIYLDDDEEVIINYCDFCCEWDYERFKKYVRSEKLDGAIPSYRGFHPHTLWSNYYAYLKLKNNLLVDIQEKTPFTDDPRNEFASSGTYYFKSGEVLKKYSRLCIDQDLNINGEYYVSLVYKPMLDDALRIGCFELDYFMQWGTPSDLEEYIYHAKSFLNLDDLKAKKEVIEGWKIIPMAGLGSRFSDQGYAQPKPLIKVMGEEMYISAMKSIPNHEKSKIITRQDFDFNVVKKNRENIQEIKLPETTDGQATTCHIAIQELDDHESLTIASCDSGMIFKDAKFLDMLNDESIDVIVWSIRNYPGALRRPKMYGWLDVDDQNRINGVSVKSEINGNLNLPIILGSFTFKSAAIYKKAYARLVERNERVNGEFYVDSMIDDCISLGLSCSSLEVESYFCWGTPEDLETFQYWQRFFSQNPSFLEAFKS